MIACSIVIPTYNERDNILVLIDRLQAAFAGRCRYEILVVDDDSPDGTWAAVEERMRTDATVRLFRRIDRRGLSSAIVDGITSAKGQTIVVMDADLQHDPAIAPQLWQALQTHDIAIATRYGSGGGVAGWSTSRQLASRLATFAARVVLRANTSDPMSGFFGLTRASFDRMAELLNPRGFKVLMEIAYHGSRLGARFAEVPYQFGRRLTGQSKLSTSIVFDFGMSLLQLASGGAISPRFARYALVGLIGVGVQEAAYAGWRTALAARTLLDESALLQRSLWLGIGTAVVTNYLLNNFWTFADRRHSSGAEITRGLVVFSLVSSTGALINWSISYSVHDTTSLPVYATMLLGIAVATTWNYLLNRGFTWRGFTRPD